MEQSTDVGHGGFVGCHAGLIDVVSALETRVMNITTFLETNVIRWIGLIG